METKLRTLVRSITFRSIALMVTIPFVGLKVALGIQVVLLIAYYFHERIWMKIEWGKQ